MKLNPPHATDMYKISHRKQAPEGTTLVYSNLTPRSDKLVAIPKELWTGKVTFFGLQIYIKEFLIEVWNANFFQKPKAEVVAAYKRRMDTSLGKDAVDTDHIEALHDLGYLPICIKALPEGAAVPIKVPVLVSYNTLPEFFWLTNYLEISLSVETWKATNSATIARHYRLLLEKYAKKTGVPLSFVDYQGHDFSFRGMSGLHDAAVSGAAHLTAFKGTDTIAAIDLIEEYYGGDAEKEVIGQSIPATEHSVASANILNIEDALRERARWEVGPLDNIDYRQLAETAFIKDLVTRVYPRGPVSYVADTFDFWRVLSECLPVLRETILARYGCLVIRPDSGDPVDIICGIEAYAEPPQFDSLEAAVLWAKAETLHEVKRELARYDGSVQAGGLWYEVVRLPHGCVCIECMLTASQPKSASSADIWRSIELAGTEDISLAPSDKGAVMCLWDIFGGDVNDAGYKVTNRHVGLIYGDSITLERATAILEGLERKKFASSNIVFGIGSFTYNYVTRDTLGFAFKSTYTEINGVGREIFKDPKTDTGAKKSARGLLKVTMENGEYVLHDQQRTIDSPDCCFVEVFRDGKLLVDHKFSEIRARVAASL